MPDHRERPSTRDDRRPLGAGPSDAQKPVLSMITPPVCDRCSNLSNSRTTRSPTLTIGSSQPRRWRDTDSRAREETTGPPQTRCRGLLHSCGRASRSRSRQALVADLEIDRVLARSAPRLYSSRSQKGLVGPRVCCQRVILNSPRGWASANCLLRNARRRHTCRICIRTAPCTALANPALQRWSLRDDRITTSRRGRLQAETMAPSSIDT